jgi:hypothetical protein
MARSYQPPPLQLCLALETNPLARPSAPATTELLQALADLLLEAIDAAGPDLNGKEAADEPQDNA